MIGLMQDRPLALPMLADRAERMFGHKRVVTATPGGEVQATWRSVVRRSRRLVDVLDGLGIPPGARVGTFGWNSQRHLELYLAVPGSGRVLHTLNHRLFADQLSFIVDDAGDDVVFVDRSLVATVWGVLEAAATVRWIVVMDDDPGAELPGDPRLLDYETLLADASEAAWADVQDEREAATLCYTSGTTGRPKGVLSSHRSVVLHALTLLGVDGFAIGERDVVMPIVPMFHVNAWGLPYAALLAGADLVLPGPDLSPSALVSQLERHRVTFTAGVPAIWRSLLQLAGEADLSALRAVVSGGSALPMSLARAWRQATGVPITSSWGMTETSPLVACSRLGTTHRDLDPEAELEVLAVPGPTAPLVQVRLVDDDGTPVPPDGKTPGEIQVAGPTVASSYVGVEPGPGSFTPDGWLRTGDVGTVDGLGYLRIVDRTKDLVKSGGEWISSVDLENEIMAHPDIAEAAVVGVPDDRWGERPVAFVIPVGGATLDEADLRAHLAGRVASWWVPDRFEVVAEIPRTATGKVSKVALRDGLSRDSGP